jgi:hypothetical protein
MRSIGARTGFDCDSRVLLLPALLRARGRAGASSLNALRLLPRWAKLTFAVA